MAERPLLILPAPVSVDRAKRRSGPGGPKPLVQTRQEERIGPRLDELEAAFEAKRLTMQTTATGLVPEDVLVLETAGTVDEFFRAAGKIEGLEFLAEYDEDDVPPDDDFFSVSKATGEHVGYRGRVYLMFANQLAFRQLLRLWKAWQRAEIFNRGWTKWRDVFSLLRDIRPWSTKDRLEETGVLEDWRERLEQNSQQLPCEIELWFRNSQAARRQASLLVRGRVEQLGGEVLSEATVEGIHYHALAVRLPASAIQDLLDHDRREEVALVQCEQIQFFRAAGQMAGRISVDSVAPLASLLNAPIPDRALPPAVALLDGLPLQAHRALTERLSVDDPDDFEANYEARFRVHGTAMASLIIWGDLNAPGDPIPQPLYVRPIMQPCSPPEGWDLPCEERVAENTLIVDLIHRAVRRMFEGDGSEPATAPDVVAINLSIGIADRPFAGTMSPLARLLDWLSWKYRILFLVSAGNHLRPIEMGRPWRELRSESPEAFQAGVVRAIAAEGRNRRLLSPAEAMNVLTVGATHDDRDNSAPTTGWLDPVRRGFPSPVNAQGQGYKRSVKPEVLAPGGRISMRQPLVDSDTQISLPSIASYRPGQLVAVAGSTAGNLTATVPSRGTSNATALVTRAAALLVPMLDELRGAEGGYNLDAVPDAVLLKALLVHGSRWGEPGAACRNLFIDSGNRKKLPANLTRLLGYGTLDVEAVRECTATRVTALAGGRVKVDTGYEHRFPLPPSLSGKRGWRQLVVSLAWMTPVNPLDHRWRRAHLWFSSPQSKMSTGSTGHLQRAGACEDLAAVQRGTLQHEVFEGSKAAAFVDGDEIVILVSCREDAGVLSEEVPYALAVTMEVADGIGVDIYSEIRERVQNGLRIVAAG